jgi:hypothetical protein
MLDLHAFAFRAPTSVSRMKRPVPPLRIRQPLPLHAAALI